MGAAEQHHQDQRYSDNFFLNQTVPMSFVGDFLVPELADPKAGYKGGDWGATYMPQDKSAASDLGGNAIVASRTRRTPTWPPPSSSSSSPRTA